MIETCDWLSPQNTAWLNSLTVIHWFPTVDGIALSCSVWSVCCKICVTNGQKSNIPMYLIIYAASKRNLKMWAERKLVALNLCLDHMHALIASSHNVQNGSTHRAMEFLKSADHTSYICMGNRTTDQQVCLLQLYLTQISWALPFCMSCDEAIKICMWSRHKSYAISFHSAHTLRFLSLVAKIIKRVKYSIWLLSTNDTDLA